MKKETISFEKHRNPKEALVLDIYAEIKNGVKIFMASFHQLMKYFYNIVLLQKNLIILNI